MAGLTTLKEAIEEALQGGDDALAVARVCAACADALPCDGAAVTAMASDVQRETLFAADLVIGQFERAQYSLGEGPSLLAFTTGRPVLVTDMAQPSTAARWPGLAREVAALPLGAVFCFPMRFGAIKVGVCAFYRRSAGGLSGPELAFVLDAVDLTTVALLELREGSSGGHLLGGWLAVDAESHRLVHQATGMVIAQLGVTAETAFARLRGHAFAQGRDLEQVAEDIVDRRLRLEPDPP